MGEKIAILGAGTMGHGIAYIAALSGFETVLFDVSGEALARGAATVRATLEKGVAAGKLARDRADAAMARFSTTEHLAEAAAGAQLVVEAVPEKIDLKKQLFAELDARCGEEVLLASNTSSLSVTEIASAAVRHPGRVLGMHFFNPPYALTLLELVRAEQTSEATLSRARELGAALGREMITVSDTPGFATSRLGVVIGLEAIRMVEQGVASPEDIDKGMVLGYKYPIGPLRLTDLVGLDVRLAIAEHLHRELGGEQFRPPMLLRRMVRAGKLGKKSGQGFYSW